MLRAELVERPVVATVEHGPERLDPIAVSLAADVLADRVLHRLMLERQHLVGAGRVRIDSRLPVGVIVHGALQRGLFRGSRRLLAATCFVARSLASATAVLPTGPRPVSCLGTALGMFLRLPPR